MLKDFQFTSESVSEGHPDKICDQISDAVLDAYLIKDPLSRVACETLVSTDFICIAGEVTSNAEIDVTKIAREVCKNIGYVHDDIGFNSKTAEVIIRLKNQSEDISRGVTKEDNLYGAQGAGDQGLMFGYAINETPEFMPAPIALSHRILKYMSELRHAGELPQIRPDSKSQVTVEYNDHKIININTVVVSTQHTEDITHKELQELIIEKILKKVLPKELISKTKYLINPTGRFVVGGPKGDVGLTGRKIIVDTYGGWGRHGGGAFSGKDPSKVDRSASYAARHCAKNIVAANLADRCEVQVAYAIGYPEPVSIYINTFNTNKIPDQEITKRVLANFDFSPSGIIKTLDLLNSKERTYLDTASYGHFGREGKTFTWEKLDKVEALKN